MNSLPKDVIVNVIIPKIVEDKNKEIAQLKEIIYRHCGYGYGYEVGRCDVLVTVVKEKKMNSLPKGVIVNVIIPKIVEDKNKEIAQLKEIIVGRRNYKYQVGICARYKCRRIIVYDYGCAEIIKGEVKDCDGIFIKCSCTHICCKFETIEKYCTICSETMPTYKPIIII